MKDKIIKHINERFNVDIESISIEEKHLRMKAAIVNNSVIFTESIVEIDNKFNLQGLALKSFQVEIKKRNDYYIRKNYRNIFPYNSKEDDILFLKKLYEVLYIDIYQDFEVFIATSFKIIYWFKPELLDEKIYTKYKKLSGKTMLLNREKIIDNKVKNIIMNGSIKQSIKTLYELIKCKIDISPKELNELYLIALNRNLIVHNLGVVNNVYLDLLSGLNIKTNLERGQYVFNDRYNSDIIVSKDIGDFLGVIVDKITNRIIEFNDK